MALVHYSIKITNNSIKKALDKQLKLGRPLEYDLEKVLETAMNLFWSKGFEATSLKDLLNATKISKSSFYYAFGSKNQLFERCLSRYCNRQMKHMLIELEKATTGRVFIEYFLKEIKSPANTKNHQSGCFLMNTVSEFAERNHAASILISRATLRFAEIFQVAIKRGQAEGVISKKKNANVLAFYLVSSVAGLSVMIKAKADSGIINEIIPTIISALD